MFKLVVLSVLVAVAVAAPKPGVLHTPLAYNAHVIAAPAISVPTAVSHQSRVDVHSAPVVRTVAVAPAVAVHSARFVSPVAPVAHVAAARYVAAAPYVTAYSAPVVAAHGLVHHF